MIVLADYIGREYDVVAWHGATANREVLTTQVLADANIDGEICVGIVKLAQLFLMELLTKQGTMPYYPTRGCSFMSDLAGGRMRTTAAVTAAFALAEYQVKTNLQAEELDTDPDDERYRSAALLGTIITGDSLSLRIELRSRSETAKLILPINIPV